MGNGLYLPTRCCQGYPNYFRLLNVGQMGSSAWLLGTHTSKVAARYTNDGEKYIECNGVDLCHG